MRPNPTRKINFEGNDVFIYLLIEFQSRVDRYMALRFAGYIIDFYKWLSKRKDIGQLPAVFPILIYNGDSRWTAGDNIKDLIIQSIPSEYIPNFKYFKLIENEIPLDTLKKIHNALSMVFYAENISEGELIESVNEIFLLLKEELPELVLEFSSWLTNLFITSGYEMGDLQEQIDNLKNPQEARTMLTTTLEKYKKRCKLEGMQEGIQEGIQKGLQQGMQQGMQKALFESAKRMLNMGLSLDIITKATGLPSEEILKLQDN